MDDSSAAGRSRIVLRRFTIVIPFSRAGRTVNEMEVNVQLHAPDALTPPPPPLNKPRSRIH
jgi:hypothetical protein